MWITHDQFAGFILGDLQRLVIATGRQQHAGQGGAGLPGVDHHVLHAVAHSGVKVGIGGNQQRRLAAQLQAHAFHRRRSGLSHTHSSAGGTGERDHVDLRMPGQCLADFRAGPADQVEYPGRQADGFDHLGQQERV
ncbi:hypothetical protein D3C81_1563340 [compost metagenome]